MNPNQVVEWNDEQIETLKRLYAEGHSTAEIGRRMGISKGSVVGKSHRLMMPPRPSPIPREKPPREEKPRPALKRRTLPLLASVADVEERLPEIAPYRGLVSQCSFPIGTPRERSFRYCDAPTLPNASYCEEHYRICVVKTARVYA